MGTLSSRLLLESWTLVSSQTDLLSRHFYARLFLSDPGLREHFPARLDIGHGRMLTAILTAIVTAARQDEAPGRHGPEAHQLDTYLRDLGRDHRKFRVGPERYSVVGSALLEALRLTGDTRWRDEYDLAWRNAYETLTATMLAGASHDQTDPPFWSATVLSHERRGPDVAIFTCQPSLPYPFRAGQYASLESPYQPRLWRAFSIANAPRKEGTLEFHVHAVHSDWDVTTLVHKLRPGDTIRLAAPMGSMLLDHRSTRDIVCVAGGTGLAPFKSFIDELARLDQQRWMHLFVGARTRDELYDLAALHRSAGRYSWLSVVSACSDDPTYPGEQDKISDVVANYGPWTEHDFYVSGSPTMVGPTIEAIRRLGVPPDRIHSNAFADVPQLALTHT